MPHILARLEGIKPEIIKSVLKADAPQHAQQGFYLEHIWQNSDDKNEVFFLFKAKNINHAKKFIKKMHTQALKENPKANLPQMVFLEEK